MKIWSHTGSIFFYINWQPSWGWGCCNCWEASHLSPWGQPKLSAAVSICFVSLYQRHGVAVLLVLLLCASLFLVYNGSFSGTSRDANDTRIRQHEQLPTEPSVRVAKPHPPVLQGYSGIIDHKVNRCGCCASPVMRREGGGGVVSNMWMMAGQSVGTEAPGSQVSHTLLH